MIEEYKLKAQTNFEILEETAHFLKTLLGHYNQLKKQVFGMIQVKNGQIDY